MGKTPPSAGGKNRASFREFKGVAEQESRNISTNIKWAYQRKFKNGDIALNYTRFLGYTRDKNHKLIIVPEESKIVKRIYREYLSGYSTSQIARNLMNDGTKTICDCVNGMEGQY